MCCWRLVKKRLEVSSEVTEALAVLTIAVWLSFLSFFGGILSVMSCCSNTAEHKEKYLSLSLFHINQPLTASLSWLPGYYKSQLETQSALSVTIKLY